MTQYTIKTEVLYLLGAIVFAYRACPFRVGDGTEATEGVIFP